jgi:excisionase family DNA binding protein
VSESRQVVAVKMLHDEGRARLLLELEAPAGFQHLAAALRDYARRGFTLPDEFGPILEAVDHLAFPLGVPGEPEPVSLPVPLPADVDASLGRMACSRSEAAERLGVSTKTIDRWVRRGLLRAPLSGGRRLIPVGELERLAGIERSAA